MTTILVPTSANRALRALRTLRASPLSPSRPSRLLATLSLAALLGVSTGAMADEPLTAPGERTHQTSQTAPNAQTGKISQPSLSSQTALPAPSGISLQTLSQSTTAWDQTGYSAYPSGIPEPTLVRITVAPNARFDRHAHPMPAIGYVTAGQLTVEREDNGAQRAFTAGQTIAELVDVPHRGWAGDAGAELLVFYTRVVQQPLSVASPPTGKLALDEVAKTVSE
ncbi:cupin domain-containing protein [Pandoraea sp. NPDC087047]|uniref:cupin domain-containing protein n=1 Tax=Pandoraea sp. NPDC087047 TaxID=3364390 RepID=UPI0037FC4B8F